MTKNDNLSFLIDEDLSPSLADLATERGFFAQSVARLVRLRGRGDHKIAKYAIDRDMIVVTNNLVDFERIYADRPTHPGLILITSTNSKLRTLRLQRMMMEIALDDVEDDEPVQECVLVTASQRQGAPLLM